MATSDLDLIGIDESFPLADILTKENMSPSPRSSELSFAERFQSHLGLHISKEFLYLFENVFSYVPDSRWDAEQVLQYIQWYL